MNLRDYATDLAGLYERAGQKGNAYRILAEHGVDGTFTPLPEGMEYGQAKGCYGNAAGRVLWDEAEEFTYFEGLAFDGIMPVEHAWLQDADGRVYDITWRHQDPRCGFCDGDGKVLITEHWSYVEDEDEDVDYEATVECEMCDGTGKGRMDDRTGAVYLGVPVRRTALMAILRATGVYGALFTAPDMVAEALASVTE